jgi:hypothetical protein
MAVRAFLFLGYFIKVVSLCIILVNFVFYNDLRNTHEFWYFTRECRSILRLTNYNDNSCEGSPLLFINRMLSGLI